MSQQEHSRANQKGWNHKAYEAWHRLGGPPAAVAEALRQDPRYTLRDYIEHLGDVEGKKVANLLGSYGKKAVALALLGAEVTVVDITEGNRRYALETAEAAGVSLNYHCTDLLAWEIEPYRDSFDFVLMEYGILHYFTDLQPLVQLVEGILKPGATWVLHEYHPLVRKLEPAQEGERLVLSGDYFSTDIVERPAPYQMAFSKAELADFPPCRYKFWQMGEIITAVGASGLIVKKLLEKAHGDLVFCRGSLLVGAKRGP